MTLELLPVPLSVCKVAAWPPDALERPWTFAARTDAERSLVTPTALVPAETLAREDGWRAFRVRGALDFSLVGVLAGLSRALAEAGVSLFAVSTFDTDYVLVRGRDLAAARAALTGAGYPVAGMD